MSTGGWDPSEWSPCIEVASGHSDICQIKVGSLDVLLAIPVDKHPGEDNAAAPGPARQAVNQHWTTLPILGGHLSVQ